VSNSGHVAWFQPYYPILSDHILSDSGIGPSCIKWTSTPYHIPLSRCQLPRVSILKGPPPRESQKSLKLLAVDLRTRLTWAAYGLRWCNFNCSKLSNFATGTARLNNAKHNRTTGIQGHLSFFVSPLQLSSGLRHVPTEKTAKESQLRPSSLSSGGDGPSAENLELAGQMLPDQTKMFTNKRE